jgi:hypothetical protein
VVNTHTFLLWLGRLAVAAAGPAEVKAPVWLSAVVVGVVSQASCADRRGAQRAAYGVAVRAYARGLREERVGLARGGRGALDPVFAHRAADLEQRATGPGTEPGADFLLSIIGCPLLR